MDGRANREENAEAVHDLATSAPLEADEEESDEGYEGSTSSTFVTSIASNIKRAVRENGRIYAAYGQHKAWVPVDDHEMDRNDLQRCKFNLLMDGKYHLAPIMEDPQKILYLGTGSGIWAIDMADFEMADKIGASGKDPIHWKRNLISAGFVDVVETVLRIPTNPWPKDPRMKKVGAFEICQFRDGVNNIFSRAYPQILGGDPAYLEVLLAKATQQMMDRKIHGWVPFYVVHGQRP